MTILIYSRLQKQGVWVEGGWGVAQLRKEVCLYVCGGVCVCVWWMGGDG